VRTASTPARSHVPTRDDTPTDVSEEHSTTSPVTVLRVGEANPAAEVTMRQRSVEIAVKVPSTTLIRKDKDSDSEEDDCRRLREQSAKHKRPSFNQRIVHKVRRSLRGGSLSSTESMPMDDDHRRSSV